MSSPPSIRPATEGDVASVRELVELAYTPWVDVMGARPMPMSWDYEALVRADEVWVAELDDQVVGLLVLKLEPDHVLLDNIAVSPTVQGQGIGAWLLGVVEEYARARSRDEVRLYTNELMGTNLAYYLHHGFTETGREGTPPYRRVFFSRRVARSI